jgi:Ca-activated chloride channel family protein
MHFANESWFLYLALPFLGLLALAAFALWRDKRDLKALGHHNLLLSPRLAWARRLAKGGLALASLFLVLGGALRPQGKPVPEDLESSGIDVMVLLDTSKSMLTEDLGPNRLEAAKRTVMDWMEGREGDRVGLTVFAGEAFTQVPLTQDLQAVGLVLEQVDVDAVDRGGTDIGEGLRVALESFSNEEAKRGKAILLLTDGEPTADASDLEEACRQAKAKGVPVVAVGVGTRRGKPLPDGVSFWGETQYKRDSRGNLKISRLDEENLKRVARITGGVMVHGDDREGLASIGKAMEGLQKTAMKGKGAVKREELSPALGAWAAALLLLGVML